MTYSTSLQTTLIPVLTADSWIFPFVFMRLMINYIYTVNKYSQQNQPPCLGLRNIRVNSSWVFRKGTVAYAAHMAVASGLVASAAGGRNVLDGPWEEGAQRLWDGPSVRRLRVICCTIAGPAGFSNLPLCSVSCDSRWQTASGNSTVLQRDQEGKGKEHLEIVRKMVSTSEIPWEGPRLALGRSGVAPSV